MEINAATIKELRDATGASIMMIKRALTEANGDWKRALAVSKSLGEVIPDKTELINRNEQFGTLAHDIAMHIAATGTESIEVLLEQPYSKDETKTIASLVKAASANFGERLEVKRFARYEL